MNGIDELMLIISFISKVDRKDVRVRKTSCSRYAKDAEPGHRSFKWKDAVDKLITGTMKIVGEY